MRALGWVFVVLGVLGIPLGFYLQSQANHTAAVAAVSGSYGGGGSAAPLVVGIGGVVLLVIGAILIAVDNSVSKARSQPTS